MRFRLCSAAIEWLVASGKLNFPFHILFAFSASSWQFNLHVYYYAKPKSACIMYNFPKIFLKTATLSLFVALISCFVAYRAGVLPDSSAGDAGANPDGTPAAGLMSAADTIPPADSLGAGKENPEARAPIIMPSSKSMPMWGAYKKKNLPDSLLKRDRIMSSSKSGIIFSDPVSSTDTTQQSEKEVKTQKIKKKNHEP